MISINSSITAQKNSTGIGYSICSLFGRTEKRECFGVKFQLKAGDIKNTSILIQASFVEWPKTETTKVITESIKVESKYEAKAKVIEVGINHITDQRDFLINFYATIGINIWNSKYTSIETIKHWFTQKENTRNSEYSNRKNLLTASVGYGIDYNLHSSMYLNTHIFYSYLPYGKSFYGINIGLSYIVI